MDFRIADTFTASLARLNGAEQKAVKTTAFDLQLNASAPGLRFHRLDRACDPNFWSVRVNDDIRLIVHRTATSLLLCYVGHHDAAYGWAERRKIERHPVTGAAQLVELPERLEIAAAPSRPDRPALAKPLLFAGVADDALLGYGVPPEWLDAVRHVDEDSLFDVADHLPQEAAEALLNLATGTRPETPPPAPADPFAHPNAQRRFRVLTNVEELERALDYPWEKWAVFLHPAQRRLVERTYGGPARISGSAGTGKTIVALHRAVVLARRHPQAQVLLTTSRRRRPRRSAAGSAIASPKVSSRTRSAFSSAPRRSSAARGPRQNRAARRRIELGDKVETTPGRVSIGTMHLAKGLEFRAVAVMACDDEVTPLQERIEAVADDADLEDVYNTERHLLYVACTRARDHLLVTGIKPGSEFLDDLRG